MHRILQFRRQRQNVPWMYEGKRLYSMKETSISTTEWLSRVLLFKSLGNKYFKSPEKFQLSFSELHYVENYFSCFENENY